MNTENTSNPTNVKRNILIAVGVIVVIAAIVIFWLIRYSGIWDNNTDTAKNLTGQNLQNTTNVTETNTANSTVPTNTVSSNTETNSTESKKVTFQDHVLTDPVAGYSATLPASIEDVRVLTSDGPKITFMRSSDNKTLRYVEMTGSAQDYTAMIKLGVAKKGASFATDWLFAGNVVGSFTDRSKTETSTLSLNGQKVTKNVNKTTDGRIIYVTYEASNNDFALSASLFNPGLIGQSFVSEFDKTITSIKFID